MRAWAAGVTVVLVGACSSGDADEPEQPEGSAVVGTVTPGQRLTVVGDTDPVAAAAAASRVLFDRAGVAVVAREGDRAGELLGASAAAGLGVPLLLETAGDATVAAEELERLGATTVLAVGEATAEDTGVEVVTVAADPGAVEGATGLDLGDAEEVADDGAVAAVAALDPEEPVALVPEGGASGEGGGDGRLPEVERAEPLEDTLVLTTGSPESLAPVATARAAGARVQVTGGATDPRASADLVELLAESEPAAVVALGADLAAEEGLDWKLDTAATGQQLPGGGQVLFPGRMLVALYGHPGTASLGLLGEQDLPGAIDRARQYAADYEDLVDVPVVPTFEIIATVASSSPDDDNDYSVEADIEVLRPWVEAAGEAGVYVVLDLQPGRTDFVTQAERYRELLELPHVGLALDPEWRLGPDEVHLTQIGSVDVEEVNRVVTWLADLTRENALPQKLLVLHQFRLDMIPGRERLDTSREEVAVLIHADGQGSQGDKQATWQALRRDAPPVWWGWKNFIDEDLPMLTPEQTVADVDPVPELVSYQ